MKALIKRLLGRAGQRLTRLSGGESPGYLFAEDGLATMHNHEFALQPRFQQAYAAGKQTGSWKDHDLRWRIHILLWCATWAARLPGAFVECGVYRGGFARAVIDYTEFAQLGKNYWLFDTFAGFDIARLSDEEWQTIAATYQYEDSYADVQRQFAAMPFVKIVRGSVPASLVDVGPVAFLSIDMNCEAPEIAAAQFFWPKLVPGAVMVLDDYGFELHHRQKMAFDEFAKNVGMEILSLPTGQGLIFKPGIAA